MINKLLTTLFVIFFVSCASAKTPNIVVLATGGTIAGSANSTTSTSYKAGDVLVDKLLAGVPELKQIANVRAEQISNIGSENMTIAIWLQLAKKINAELAKSDVDGIVITHGTDTMEETAYFLNLVVKSNKPVVMVGAMRSSSAMSADGPKNLFNATLVAGHVEAKGKGVMVVLNDIIHSARDVVKMNTTSVETFHDANVGSLGAIHGNEVSFYRTPMKKHTKDSEFDVAKLEKLPYVGIVYGYADVDDIAIKAYVENKVEGLVYAAVGDGSLNAKTAPALTEAMKKGIVAIRSSRIPTGAVTNSDWGPEYKGTIPSGTLSPYKSRVLLMLALTKTKDPAKIKEYFEKY